MLGASQSFAIVVLSTVLSIAVLYLIQRLWEPSRRRSHNDVIGPSVNVIGTMYAVIIAFMLSGVWGNFRAAIQNTEIEANSLVSIGRLSRAFPATQGERIRSLTMQYANVMIDKEWPAMTQEQQSPQSHAIMMELWTVIPTTPTQSQLQAAAVQQALTELSAMTEHRRIRIMQSRSKLPTVLWIVLLLGGIITILAACMFGVEDFKIHALQVGALTLITTIALVAIADIDHPFSGAVHVRPTSFQYALETLSEIPATPVVH
jgi:hypothetical protein